MRKQRGLTSEQVGDYIEGGGANCPWCESDQIEGGSIEVDGEIASQNMTCNACSQRWTDNFRRSSIYAGVAVGVFYPVKKIYVCVSGGVVNEVYGPAHLQVVVIDDDNGEVDADAEAENKKLKSELEKMKAEDAVIALDLN
ncbi:MAG: hypothetical protein PHW33_01715 [Candidatus Portnoybacteria bacterium]|nr:hypothetical protein [Candidatus Portnoybacteria bacterium]